MLVGCIAVAIVFFVGTTAAFVPLHIAIKSSSIICAPEFRHQKSIHKMADQSPTENTAADDNMPSTSSTASTAAASNQDAASRAIDFLTLSRTLKTTKRTGWVMRGVHNPESVADHMYRMSLMSMIASFSNGALDTNKCIKLALIHDLAEAKVGDITPHCGVSDDDKYKLELGTMEQIQQLLGSSMGGDEIIALWKEYEEGTTEEAKLLKDLDKIEMIPRTLR